MKKYITIITTKIITVISIIVVLLKYFENVQKVLIHTLKCTKSYIENHKSNH